MDGRSVVALVPAYSEAGRVGATVRALRRVPEIAGVLVVDDGSSDSTAGEALHAGAAVAQVKVNLGKGGALNTGVRVLRRAVRSGVVARPDVLLLADADLAESATNLRPLIAAVLHEGADLAVADLPPQRKSQGFGVAMIMTRFGNRRFGVD